MKSVSVMRQLLYDSGMWKCPFCNFRSNYLYGLKVHMRKCIRSTFLIHFQLHKCIVCGRAFKNDRGLYMHFTMRNDDMHMLLAYVFSLRKSRVGKRFRMKVSFNRSLTWEVET
jgi:rubredoxin